MSAKVVRRRRRDLKDDRKLTLAADRERTALPVRRRGHSSSRDQEATRQIEQYYWPKIEGVLKYSDEQLEKELLPLYRRMMARFRRNAGLAEESTRA